MVNKETGSYTHTQGQFQDQKHSYIRPERFEKLFLDNSWPARSIKWDNFLMGFWGPRPLGACLMTMPIFPIDPDSWCSKQNFIEIGKRISSFNRLVRNSEMCLFQNIATFLSQYAFDGLNPLVKLARCILYIFVLCDQYNVHNTHNIS